MKKIISFMLAALLLVSAVPTALATNDYTQGTRVEYTATSSESYTITVPALLAPGGNGTVTLQGTWADNRIVTVTADPTVTLTNSIKADDQKVLNVTFAGISEAGSNTGSQTFAEAVSVANIENALFGTWSGKFNYNVEIDNAPTPILGSITFNDGVTLSWDELKLEDNGDKYGYNETAITDTEIGLGAFYSCSSITKVTIPDSVTKIGQMAFQECKNITSVGPIGSGASVEIPSSVTSIGSSAFRECGAITIDIPNGVNTISDDAFGWNDTLTSLTIPDSVTYLGKKIIAGCRSLTNIDLPANKNIVGMETFSDSSLTSITIPDGTTSIPVQAFYNCYSLTSVTIPDSVETLGKWSFSRCPALKNITFKGTMEQWNEINFIDGWNQPLSGNIEILVTCTDGTITVTN